MTRITALLLATAALAAAAVLAGPTAALAPVPDKAVAAATAPIGSLRLASGAEEDDDDDDDSGARQASRSDDDDDDDDDCDDDEGGACAMGLGPTPAGSVAPPANGLFGSGAAPQVQLR